MVSRDLFHGEQSVPPAVACGGLPPSPSCSVLLLPHTSSTQPESRVALLSYCCHSPVPCAIVFARL